ncbi:hypothetical protein M3B46_17060 [Sphingobacterium daejeonense]|uniref:hypothetical protein n=1 Tax=Sphingobacterium daejeonense TaxID=371142 RepID=UPI0021A4E640|nr:hypothetical protein [Sphingobacterium daejeonense]MCT1532718.1 hypothetical protein [Sphingobacterium daejeonense]
MKYILSLALLLGTMLSYGQQVEHISKLELGKKDKKVFNRGDSSMVLKIDTLIMKDRSKIEFYAKKDVKLEIGYAEIGKNVVITGQDSKNNATDINMDVKFNKLGSLFVIARGIDAFNGTKTHPNGDGGDVVILYDPTGIKPQFSDKKANNYLFVDVQEGGLRVNPTSEIGQIYSRISMAQPGLRGMPQGQIYSGSPGKKGSVVIEGK